MPVVPKVKRIIFGVGPPEREYSMVRHGSLEDSFQHRPEYEHLVGMDPVTGAFVPELATSWEYLPDSLSFRFTLQEGVQFHGEWGEFTAHDVVHSHQQLVREDSRHPKAAAWRSDVVSVAVEGDRMVVFELSRPAAEFMSMLGEQRGMLPIQSKAHFDAEGEPSATVSRYLAGTGPYQFLERELRTFIRFERPPEPHWRVRPDFEELEFRFMASPSNRMAALVTGQIHIADLPFDLGAQARDWGMRVAQGSSPSLRVWVNLWCCWADPDTGAYPARSDSPLTNVTVRKALAKTIERPYFGEAFYGDSTEPMYLNHWHPTRLGWNPRWEEDFPEQYGYDPAAARALLASAGYNASNRLETTVELVDLAHFPDAFSFGEAVGGFFSDAGVDVTLMVRLPELRRAARIAREDANLITIEATSADQYLGFAQWNTPIHTSHNANNFPEATELTKKALRTPDLVQQAAVWRDLGNLSYSAYLTLPLFWLPEEAYYDPEFIADYIYPGSIPGTWTHVQNIRAAG